MRRVVRLLAAIALVVVGTPWTASGQTLQMKIGAAGATDHAPVFAGVEKGIFAKHGLDAKVIMYPTGVEMINGLVAGAQEANVMGSVPFLAGVSNGLPLVLIGHLHGDPNRTEYTDNVSIVASPGSGVKVGDVKALKGKRVATPFGAGGEGYLLGMLAQNGMKPSDISMLNVKPSDLVTALRNGDADAMAIWEPWASTAIIQVPGSVRVTAGACQGCYDPGTILTTNKVIAEKAEVLKRFMVAFAEAQQWVRQNFDVAAEINMRWIPGVDLETMKMAIRRSVYDHRMSRYTRDMYAEKAIPFLLGQKRLKKSFDPGTVIDSQFYLYAEKTAPQFYADLPPIPDAIRLK
jgi:NitT/TauT family transport system substrate-binding protein/sulfonate transport system substrate-binding protein